MKLSILFLILISFTTKAQIAFQNNPISLGLNFSTGSSFLGSGVSFYDYNDDGWDDLTFATGDGQNIKFFKNNLGVFSEETLITGITYRTKQINWVDIDNDGDKDLFVTSDTNGNKLFINNGNSIFQDITNSSGLVSSNTFSYGASWGDYNNDGYLDVFISNRSETIPNKLYKNNGDNTFTDVSIASGISASGTFTFCSIFFDYNNDGWQDIYLSNDKYNYSNVMYKNNGDGTFTDESESSQTDISIDAMTTTIGDYNNDGWFDLYVTNTINGNVFFKNNGNGSFSNVTSLTTTSFNSIGWGSVFLDIENDGDLDLYVSGSLDGSVPSLSSSALYKNLNTGVFENTNNIGFNTDNFESYSNAIGDFNNDGLSEICVNNGNNQNISFWQNNTSTNNNWLKVNLEGVVSNKDGVGSVIEISINGNKQYRYTNCGEGYLSQNSDTELFGIGNATVVDYIKIKWLSGIIDVFNNVAANQALNIVEGSTVLSVEDYSIVNKKNFIIENPVDAELKFNSELNIQRIEIYNLQGQLINIFENRGVVDVSAFNSGTYLVKVNYNNKSTFLKFIKK